MNRKIKIIGIVIAVIFAMSTVVWSFSPKKNLKPSEYEIGVSYKQAVKDKKPMVVMFYADWCTYCIRFMPKYKILSEIYKGKYNFVMINADNSENKDVTEDYSIGGFPTIYIIDPSIDNRVLISNTIYDDLRAIRTELDRYLRVRAMINK